MTAPGYGNNWNGIAEYRRGNLAGAGEAFRQALAVARELGEPYFAARAEEALGSDRSNR